MDIILEMDMQESVGEIIVIVFSFSICGVGSPKTRWAGCKLACNHEPVVPPQFAEAKRRNPTPKAISRNIEEQWIK